MRTSGNKSKFTFTVVNSDFAIYQAELRTYVNKRVIRGGLHCSEIIIKLVKGRLGHSQSADKEINFREGFFDGHLVSLWQTDVVNEESKLKLPP